MKRAVIALILAFAAIALLISLALESRSLPVETHVAQYTITGDLARLESDFRALTDTLSAAWQEQQRPGEGARALLDRQLEVSRRLSEAAAMSRRQLNAAAPLRTRAEAVPVYLDVPA